MRIGGQNVLAILAAAIAMYLVEFLLYGILVPATTYQALAHIDPADAIANGWKMPFGIIGPIWWASGIAIAMGWRGAKGWREGAMVGFVTALFFLLSARFYVWGYGPTGFDFFALDAFHYLVCGALGGAIIGAWPAAKT